MLEAAEGSNFADGHHGSDEFESFEGHESFDERFALPAFEEGEHGVFDLLDAFGMKVNGGKVVLENDVVGRIREGEMTKVALVCFSPVGLAIIVKAKASKHGEKAGFGTAKVINGISAGTTEITNGFVDRVGDIDRDEVIGTEQFGEFGGVPLVGFDSVTGFGWDQGRSDDITSHSHLEETPRDPEPAPASFVAKMEVGKLSVVVFGNTANGSFEGMLRGGNGAVVARFGAAVIFEDGDDGLFFMNIKSEIECLWCV